MLIAVTKHGNWRTMHQLGQSKLGLSDNLPATLFVYSHNSLLFSYNYLTATAFKISLRNTHLFYAEVIVKHLYMSEQKKLEYYFGMKRGQI